ncbi:MAG: CDP-diacylglycerol--glycerol-3-phosphate 3-phosphatidyltransferase [Aeriscardovia sp.]|nr:CDP-diacylglycerol--glycerol-3-phosphate 3-phosphatidyltransferase [Aeriscardovia sp.]
MTPANIVTYVRILMVVAIIVLLSLGGPAKSDVERWVAAALFVIAACTDKLDGYLARSRNEVTTLGKLLDPVADKLLICSCLIVLSCFGTVWWWVTILFLIREAWITALRIYAKRKHGIVAAADFLGKLKTVFECVAVGMMLFPLWVLRGMPYVLAISYYYLMLIVLGMALVLCFASGTSYTVSIFSQMKKAGRAK